MKAIVVSLTIFYGTSHLTTSSSKRSTILFGIRGNDFAICQIIFIIKNMSFQTTDSKKEEFRKYLEKSGVIDQLTRVLVGLYEEPEKPNNAIE